VTAGLPRTDLGLLVLRAGLGLSFILLALTREHAVAGETFGLTSAHAGLLAVLVLAGAFAAIGFRTRVASGVAAVGWLCAAAGDLLAGEDWVGFPVRAFVYALLFLALSLAGPGRFSIDRRLERRR